MKDFLRSATVAAMLTLLPFTLATAEGRARSTCIIEVEGDSLAYGQDTSSPRTQPPINGASQSRSIRPFPEYLSRLLGSSYAVVNHGFPGDRTIEGLKRWHPVPHVRIGILLFGTNDALNFGGYPDGTVPPYLYAAHLGKLIDRYRQVGARTILIAPPPLADTAQDRRLDPYRAALRALAQSRSLPVVSLQRTETQWVDGLHLDPVTNTRLGQKLLPLMRGCTS